MASIMVFLDSAEASTNAARYAADLASAIGADLFLVQAMHIPTIPGETPVPDDVLHEMRDSSLTFLETLASELIQRTSGKIRVTANLETGETESKIRDFCQRKKPFLVVISASAVLPIHPLPFPLLLIPEHAVFHPIRNILLACDEEDITVGIPAPVEFFRQLRDLLGAQFYIIHVTTNEKPAKKKAWLKSDRGEDSLQQGYPELHFISATSVEEGVRKYLGNHTADWLLAFPKKNNLFHLHKSISKMIVLHCPVPAMIFGN